MDILPIKIMITINSAIHNHRLTSICDILRIWNVLEIVFSFNYLIITACVQSVSERT